MRINTLIQQCKKNITTINWIVVLAFFIVLLILYLQAFNWLWRRDLQVDIYAYYYKVTNILKNKSFSQLKNNEYLPGSLLFFFAPLLIMGKHLIFSNYLRAFLQLNILLILTTVVIYKTQISWKKISLFLILVQLTGPILLFRFELFMALLVSSSLILWQKKKMALSGFVLGISLMVKLYPVIIIPYLLVILYYQKGIKKTFSYLFYLILGVSCSLIIFFLLNGNIQQITNSLMFHAKKPIGIDSIYGTVITGISLIINKSPPKLIAGFGVWGIKSLFGGFTPKFINWCWMFPVISLYIFLFFKGELKKQMKIGIIFLFILIFLIFSKNFNPQYYYWFVSLFPLLQTNLIKNNAYFIIFIILSLVLLFCQLIYPIFYVAYIKEFFYLGRMRELYLLACLRDLGIILLALLSFYHILIKRDIQ